MTAAALVLAIIGVVLSLASLGWQVWTWRGSGPRVKVSTTNSFPVYGSEMGDQHLTVKATNVGRSATTITGWGLRLPGDKAGDLVVTAPVPWSSPLPHRLEPHAEAQWHMPADEVREHARRRGVSLADFRAWVDVAGAGRVFATGKFPVA